MTGFLIFSSGRFLQLLEGDEIALDRTLSKIRTDGRHRDMEVLCDQPIAAQWTMRRIGASDSSAARDFLAAALNGPPAVSIETALDRFFAGAGGASRKGSAGALSRAVNW
ncbi:BLUF family blue-light photosensor [Erythrobacter litoralis]|uniref:BLUF domain-containing protein n=1 Tax=Erythrobacter litoralis TaxID=39960 RepID=A0A074MNP5_9SPHN|nr:BLUF domain-containing protein [Erythrobacter litoralis]AOL21971.1 BLUF family blue-light photosensor [Erythrobacter litoralis]KEO96591.1 hypothetical protein EH32_10205 [Erythrobacter litoralis]